MQLGNTQLSQSQTFTPAVSGISSGAPGVDGIYNIDPSNSHLVLRSLENGSIITDYGRIQDAFNFTMFNNPIEITPDGKLIILAPSDGGIFICDPVVDDITQPMSLYRITSDIGVTSAFRMRFDSNGRLYFLCGPSISSPGPGIHVVRLNTDNTLDRTFDLLTNLSTDALPDTPGISVGSNIMSAGGGIDMSYDGRYVYVCTGKGNVSNQGVLNINIYKFDLDDDGSGVLWKQFPWYTGNVNPSGSVGHSLISAPSALAVDPVTGNVAVVVSYRFGYFITYTGGIVPLTFEHDNFEYYLKIYDSNGSEVSSALIGRGHDSGYNPVTGAGSGGPTGFFFYITDTSTNHMRWTSDGSNVYYWSLWSATIGESPISGIYIGDKSGIISEEFYIGNILTPTRLIPTMGGQSNPGLARYPSRNDDATYGPAL